ncbi:MAG: transcription antitermination factor NusB [Lachnospiraceae bacterium]|nr:transcription antitermination factor NusB [Lachnospiraceae bacterium]
MSRRELREQIFKLLFRVEFNEVEEMPEQLALFFEQDEPLDEADKEEISTKYTKILEKKDELDNMLNEKATGWTVDRMGKVDLTILRLALFEMLYDDKVPVSVAINEAVELAKKFGQTDSPGFINGVLAKFAN